jgi:hypothetical protein
MYIAGYATFHLRTSGCAAVASVTGSVNRTHSVTTTSSTRGETCGQEVLLPLRQRIVDEADVSSAA